MLMEGKNIYEWSVIQIYKWKIRMATSMVYRRAFVAAGLSVVVIVILIIFLYLIPWFGPGRIILTVMSAALLMCLLTTKYAVLTGLSDKPSMRGMLFGFSAGGLILVSQVLFISMMVTSPNCERIGLLLDPGISWPFHLVMLGGILQCVAASLMMERKSASTLERGECDR